MSDFVTDTFCCEHGPHEHGLCPYCIEHDARVAAEQIASDERIGGLCYKGNSVSWTYSKAQNYGKALDKIWEALREIGVPCDGQTHAADAIRKFCMRRQAEERETGK